MNWKLVIQLSLFGMAMYIANHPQEAAMMTSMPLPDSPRLMMTLMGPAIGVASGLVLGLFSVIAVRLTNARTKPAIPTR